MTKINLDPDIFQRIELGAVGPSDIKRVVDSLANDLVESMEEKLQNKPFTDLDSKMVDEVREKLTNGIQSLVNSAFGKYMRTRSGGMF